jgi:hypothetical protein
VREAAVERVAERLALMTILSLPATDFIREMSFHFAAKRPEEVCGEFGV